MGSAASRQGEQFVEVMLVRHGETDCNLSDTIQGRRMDPDLNGTGCPSSVRRIQARPAAIYSSDMERAVQTAQPIAAASGSHVVSMHMGSFQGRNKDDVIRSEAFETFIRGGRDQEIPGGGESLNQLSERCVSCLNAIAKKHKGERVVVVSHELDILEICRHANPTGSDGRKFPNTSISVVHISDSDGRWILEKFGDVQHLAGDGFP